MEGEEIRVKIYALFNKKENAIFYIGATTQPLKARLSGHINRRLQSRLRTYLNERCVYKSNVEIIELDDCDYFDGSQWERFYMDLFRSFGFTLIQGRNSNYNECKPLIRARGEMSWRRSLNNEDYTKIANPYNL